MAKTKSKKLHKKGNFTLFIMIGGIIIVLLSAFIVNTSNINSNPQAALTIAERRARTLAELKKEQAKLKAKQAQKNKNTTKTVSTSIKSNVINYAESPIIKCQKKYGYPSEGFDIVYGWNNCPSIGKKISMGTVDFYRYRCCVTSLDSKKLGDAVCSSHTAYVLDSKGKLTNKGVLTEKCKLNDKLECNKASTTDLNNMYTIGAYFGTSTAHFANCKTTGVGAATLSDGICCLDL